MLCKCQSSNVKMVVLVNRCLLLLETFLMQRWTAPMMMMILMIRLIIGDAITAQMMIMMIRLIIGDVITAQMMMLVMVTIETGITQRRFQKIKVNFVDKEITSSPRNVLWHVIMCCTDWG